MAKTKYILTFDQGTGSSRAILLNQKQEIVGMEQRELRQIYPKPGWVEQSPDEIWKTQMEAATAVLKKCDVEAGEIQAIGITNQRETVIVWDKESGKPVYNAIVWQDRRTSDYCRLLKHEGLEKHFREKTGLAIDAYFSATKIDWILKHIIKNRKNAENGKWLFGTVDSWLIWKLTGGKAHITDCSNASRTMLFNINTLDWDNELLHIFKIPKAMLPEIKPSSAIAAYTDSSVFDGVKIPIAGIAGDQQAALFGQTCFNPGMVKNTYGTGCFMLMNTGTRPVPSQSNLLTTVAWKIDNETVYALEGSVFITGAAIKWLRDALKIIKSAEETERIAEQVKETQEVYFVPAFTGLGAPYWDMDARGMICGLTQGVNDKHIVRACLESIAYQTKDVVDAMLTDSGIQLKELNADGGASANNFLMQFQSDMLNTKVIRPSNIETTALGAAFLAGLATGFWDKDSLIAHRKIARQFSPKMKEQEREKLYAGWQKAVEKVKTDGVC